ncbi:MAG: SRPBCC family protein [Acidimicrobiia bacterium]|nr:SRPBCC family protein [Acidimicrobiia bacterium]NNF65808.1 SRPBCC family protein [Acidimicrobiia bacterium]
MSEVRVTAESTAPPHKVTALLADGQSWPDWSPIGEAWIDKQSDEVVGEVRRFKTGRTVSIEEVVAFEPGRRLQYRLVEGLPLRDYLSTIYVEYVDGGSAITWHSTFEARRPGTGGIYRWMLRRFLQDMVDGLAKAAAAE